MDLDEGSEVDDEDVWWYICTLCNRAYTADTQLRAHKRQWHGAEKAKGAGVRILSQGVDLAPVVKLTRCPSSSSSTKSHFSQDCDDPEEAVKSADRGSSKPTCPECGKSFRDNYTLKRHRRLVPNGKGRKPNWNSNGCRSKSLGGAFSGTCRSHKDTFLLPSRLVKGAWDCRLCGKVVKEAALHQHVQRVHPDVEEEEGRRVEPDAADLAPIGPPDLHHKCQQCLEQFPTHDNLKTHVLLVHAPPERSAAGPVAPNLKTESPSPVRDAEVVVVPELESPHERHTPEEAIVCVDELNIVDEKPRLRSRSSREVAVAVPEDAAVDQQEQVEASEENPPPPRRSSRHSKPAARLLEKEETGKMCPQCPLCHKVLRDKYSLQRHKATVHASDRENTFRNKDVITIVAAFLRQCEQQRQQEAADPLSLAIESSRIRCPICLDFYPNLAAKFEQHVRNKHAKHLYRAEHHLPCHCMTCYKAAFLRPSAPKEPTSDAASSAWECKSCGASVNQVAIRAHVRRKHADHIMLPPPPQVGDSEWRTTASRLGEGNEPPTLAASAASVDEADGDLEENDQAEVEDEHEIEDDTFEPDDNPSMSPQTSEGGGTDLDSAYRHRIEKYAVIIPDPERASSVHKPRGAEAQRATRSTKLRCRICSKVYPGCSDKFRRHFIADHISKISTSGPPTCQICPKKLRTPGSLRIHMKLVHGPDFGHPDPLQMQTKDPEMPVESGHQVEEELENETYAHSEGVDSRPSNQAAGEEGSSASRIEPEYKEEEGAEADSQASEAEEYKVELLPEPEPTLPHDEGEPPRLRPRTSRRSVVQSSYVEFNSEGEDDADAPDASYSPPPSSPASSSSEEEDEEEKAEDDCAAASESESECEDKPNSSRSSTRGRFSCPQCPRSYADQYGLRKHIKAAHEDVPRGSSRTYQWRDNSGGTEVRSLIDTFTANCKQRMGRLHQCSLCYNWYEGARKLRQHTHKHFEHLIRIRDGSDSCDCVYCYQNAYLRPTEGVEVPWECRLCKWVVGEAGIRLHMRSFHKGHETPSIMRQEEEEKEMSEWRKVKTSAGVPQEGEGAAAKELVDGIIQEGEGGGSLEGKGVRVKCPICHNVLCDKYNLKRHLETVHGTKGASIDAIQVDPKVVTAFLEQHEQKEGQERVKCSICLAFLPDFDKFEKHVRNKHTKHLQRAKERLPCHCMTCYKDGFLRPTSVATTECAWECKLCGESVKEIAIRMHVQRNHGDHEMLAPGEAAESEWRSAVAKLHEGGVGVDAEEMANEEEGTEFQCRICQKVYSSSSTLRRHLRSLHSHNSLNRPNCQICQKKFKTRQYLRYHMKMRHGPDADSRNHLCSTCGQSFKTGTELRFHSRRHDPSSSDAFNCDICGKPCFHSGALRRHKLSHQAHSVPCPHCGKTFKSGNCIQIHLARTHGEALYKCTKCDKSYTTRKHLAEHEAIHREDTPFQCPKAFKSKKLLGHHSNKVHTERFHLCHVCGQEFRKKGRALQHELDAHNFQRVEVAKIFECEYKGCGRKFATVFMLNQHQTVHNERSLQCETCGKGFKAKHHLDQHKMTHVPYEELPYVCDICGKRSGWPAHAREHKQRIHGVGAKKVTQSKRKPGSESETEKELEPGRGNND